MMYEIDATTCPPRWGAPGGGEVGDPKLGRELRRNRTPAEARLWTILRCKTMGVKFRRQHQLGPYFVDFVCLPRRLVIEVDGGQHAASEADRIRDAWLWEQGFQVMRFWNHEVLDNLDGVHARIQEELARGSRA